MKNLDLDLSEYVPDRATVADWVLGVEAALRASGTVPALFLVPSPLMRLLEVDGYLTGLEDGLEEQCPD